MYQDVTKHVRFLVKNKLTPSQFLLLYLIRTKKQSIMKEYSEAFPTEDGSFIGSILRDDLIQRKLLIKVKEGKTIDCYEVGEELERLFIKDSWIAAGEFWNKYPPFVSINGKNIPLTVADRYEFTILYSEAIGHSIDEHLEVLQDIEFGVNKELIKSNIETFVKSRGWEAIRKIRLNQANIIKAEKVDEQL